MIANVVPVDFQAQIKKQLGFDMLPSATQSLFCKILNILLSDIFNIKKFLETLARLSNHDIAKLVETTSDGTAIDPALTRLLLLACPPYQSLPVLTLGAQSPALGATPSPLLDSKDMQSPLASGASPSLQLSPMMLAGMTPTGSSPSKSPPPVLVLGNNSNAFYKPVPQHLFQSSAVVPAAAAAPSLTGKPAVTNN